MRRKILTIFLLILLFCSLTTNVFAAEKEYTIEDATFVLVVDEYGDVTVSERWTVTYEEGKFTRFYKNIFLGVPEDEEFDIEFLEVLVDGRECTYTRDTDARNDFTYSTVKSSDKIRYEVYMHSEEVTRKFEINYVLKGAVKCVDDEYYLLKFRALPKGFQQEIESTHIIVTLPNEDFEVLSCSVNQGYESYQGSVIMASGEDVDDLYKINIQFDGDMKYAVDISSDDTNSDYEDSIWSYILPIMIIFAPIALFGVIIYHHEKKKETQLQEELAHNPYLMISLYQKWVPHYFTPAEFSWLLTRNRCLSFMIHLAELVHRNIISIDEGYEYITFPKNYGNDSVLRILDESRIYALKKKMETPEDQYYWYLPVVHLEKFFVSNKGFSMLQQLIYTPLSKTKNLKDKVLSQDVKKIQAIARLLHKDKSMPSISFATVAAQYSNSAHYVPYYCFQSQSMVNTDGEDIEDMSVILTTIALATYASHMSSSDTGTSCSSCSSCGGGCGGCGGSD